MDHAIIFLVAHLFCKHAWWKLCMRHLIEKLCLYLHDCISCCSHVMLLQWSSWCFLLKLTDEAIWNIVTDNLTCKRVFLPCVAWIYAFPCQHYCTSYYLMHCCTSFRLFASCFYSTKLNNCRLSSRSSPRHWPRAFQSPFRLRNPACSTEWPKRVGIRMAGTVQIILLASATAEKSDWLGWAGLLSESSLISNHSHTFLLVQNSWR